MKARASILRHDASLRKLPAMCIRSLTKDREMDHAAGMQEDYSLVRPSGDDIEGCLERSGDGTRLGMERNKPGGE